MVNCLFNTVKPGLVNVQCFKGRTKLATLGTTVALGLHMLSLNVKEHVLLSHDAQTHQTAPLSAPDKFHLRKDLCF